ncbi:hypothetical protein BDFG_07322 [Blastomyces dermatitidis ATCC 26199]|nr:hypothetical protein BDFG_07322 [Blastomyces dermatitidis ATCC 26199]
MGRRPVEVVRTSGWDEVGLPCDCCVGMFGASLDAVADWKYEYASTGGTDKLRPLQRLIGPPIRTVYFTEYAIRRTTYIDTFTSGSCFVGVIVTPASVSSVQAAGAGDTAAVFKNLAVLTGRKGWTEVDRKLRSVEPDRRMEGPGSSLDACAISC